MRTILAVSNTSSKGKSATLKEFALILILKFPSHKIIFMFPSIIKPHGDFRLVIEINGKIIAIESQGDPNTDLEHRLSDICKNYKPDIIICTCRTRGQTVDAVNKAASTFSYQKIWTSTYQMDANHSIVNQLKAKHILELLQTIKLI
jgi:hypothetical protein